MEGGIGLGKGECALVDVEPHDALAGLFIWCGLTIAHPSSGEVDRASTGTAADIDGQPKGAALFAAKGGVEEAEEAVGVWPKEDGVRVCRGPR